MRQKADTLKGAAIQTLAAYAACQNQYLRSNSVYGGDGALRYR
ncbi:hypothetical protein [Microseira sp. BLCC-F43]